MEYRKAKAGLNKSGRDYSLEAFDGQIDTIRTWIDRLAAKIPEKSGETQLEKDLTYQTLITAIEELSVAGEELHQQNEALLNTRSMLEEERRRYVDLFELAPNGYLVTDLVGKVQDANQLACELFNLRKEYLVGKPLLPLVDKSQRVTFMNALTAIRTGETRRLSFETKIQPRREQPVNVAITAAAITDHENEPASIRWLINNIDERRQFEVRLYESEARFQTVFASAGIGVAILGLDGKIQVINPALLRILGFPELPPVGLPFEKFVHQDDLPTWQARFESLIRGRIDNRYYQCCLVGKDGEQTITRVTLSLVRSVLGRPNYVILIAENITDEKRMEQELIDVEGRLTDSAEAERIHLAQDLHDGPLQDLYGIMYQLKMVSLGKVDEATYHELDRAQEMVQSTIDKLRATTGGLRPPTLAHFGLERGIRSYFDNLGEMAQGLEIHLDLEKDEETIGEKVRNTLFRIFQECMVNVLRHAHATRVDVSLRLDEEKIYLEITDDGAGFAVPDRWVEMVAAGHYGLVGAAERAVSIGGILAIHSSPGEGTHVQVAAPRKVSEQVQHERLSVLVTSPSPTRNGPPKNRQLKDPKRDDEG